MEIHTGKYTNFILTVIAILLLGLLFQTSVGLVANAQAQNTSRLDGVRDDTANRNEQQARVQRVVNQTSDPAVAQGLQAIASSVRDVADALREVARGSERVASAIREVNPGS